MSDHLAPRAEYVLRLTERTAAAARLARLDLGISRGRLAAIAGAVLVAWLSWRTGVMSKWWLTAPAATFFALVAVHGRVIASHREASRSVDFYTRGLARLDHEWIGTGVAGDRFLSPSHLYAADLDLFGRGSLFELLCTARTEAGEQALADWLLTPASPVVVGDRQAAVQELRPLVDLREDLWRLGADVRADVHPAMLAAWGLDQRVLPARGFRTAAALLAASSVVTLSLWLAGATGPIPWLAFVGAGVAFAGWLRVRVCRVVGSVESASHDLAVLSHILARLERGRFTSPRLLALQAELGRDGMSPSRRIEALLRLIGLLDARRNQMFAPLAALLLWATQFAFAIEAWRAVTGESVPRWLAAVGEFEALSALAGYAWEHPDDPFPELVSADRGPLFDGEALGHPLVPDDRCVRNDVYLTGAGGGGGLGAGSGPQVLVVSGSNMSGKSTLLRTVGVNTVLAQAGAPVRARRLRLTPLAVGATLRVQDSLQGGTSRFYAEITRLRAIVGLTAGTPPPLFLLDELLNGTNSHDRRIGAEGVLRTLVDRGAIGLVSTHDLALAKIADDLAFRAANVHFEDQLVHGEIRFDYACRPGVVTTSNALALMRAVGIDV